MLRFCPGPRPELRGGAGSVPTPPIRSRQFCSMCVRHPWGCHGAGAMGGSFCDHTEPGWVLLPGLSQGPGLPLTGERRCSFLLLSGPWRLSMTLGGRAASSQAPAGGRPVARGPAVMGRCAQAPMPSSPGLSCPDCLVPEVNPLCCGWTVTA